RDGLLIIERCCRSAARNGFALCVGRVDGVIWRRQTLFEQENGEAIGSIFGHAGTPSENARERGARHLTEPFPCVQQRWRLCAKTCPPHVIAVFHQPELNSI